MSAGTALITGASSGIGEALARVVAADGLDLVLVARRQERLRHLADELAGAGGRVEVLTADLLDGADLRRVEQRVASRDEPITELLNNAGITFYEPLAASDVDHSLRQVALHLEVPLRLMHAALPGMLERRAGGVLNVGSTAGLQATPGLAAYAASKSALICLSESVHDELRGTGVRITCVAPGYTRTELQATAGVDASALPSASWMSAEAVARAAWRGHLRGRALVVPGALNQATALALRLAPRSAARRAAAAVVRRVQPS